MLTITFEIDAPGSRVLEIKESLAMQLEAYGDVKVVRVVEDVPRQTEIKRKGKPDGNQRQW